jgi:hypothetical protein
VDVVDERELGHSAEELLLVLGQARESGSIDVGDARLFAAVLELRDVDARSAMTPRIDLETVATDRTIGDVLEAAATSGHTRLPVYEGDVDHVGGIVHVKVNKLPLGTLLGHYTLQYDMLTLSYCDGHARKHCRSSDLPQRLPIYGQTLCKI